MIHQDQCVALGLEAGNDLSCDTRIKFCPSREDPYREPTDEFCIDRHAVADAATCLR